MNIASMMVCRITPVSTHREAASGCSIGATHFPAIGIASHRSH